MQPENLRFGGGAAETMLHPIVAVWMLIAIVLIVALPRKQAASAFLLAVFTIPLGQVVVLGGVHFTVLRILIIAGLARWATLPKRAKFPGGFTGIDAVVIPWTVATLVTISVQWMEVPAFIRAVGAFLDYLGGYLVVRSFIPDRDAVIRALKTLAVICAIQGTCMVIEQVARVNVFGFLGGVPVGVVERGGRLRSSGVMGYIYSGVFAGALIPLFYWLWRYGKSRIAGAVGLISALTMVVTSNSSTSALALIWGMIGLAFWRLRTQMRYVRWGLAVLLLALHLVMKAPVWALIGRVDLTGSSSGFHRYMLMDNCIRHFGDWWIIGYKNYETWGWDMWDLCNQFVAVALTGGLITLVLYVAIYKRSFAAIGRARRQVQGDPANEWFFWCLGSTLFAHVIAHFGINYMAMGMMELFPLFAMACVGANQARLVSESAQVSDIESLAEVDQRVVVST